MTAYAAFETTRDPASSRRGRAALYVASGIVLALVFRWGMAHGSGGDWVAPLDDTYIHFQYAKLIARGEPFAWSPGDGYTTGATSVIWPLMLAIPHALGLGPGTIYALAVTFGAVALASTAMMVAAHLERRLADPMSATLAGLAAVTGGSMLWGTFSGMEIPLATAAWTGAAIVLARWEGGSPPSPFGYVVLAALPLVRPEGVAVFAAVAAIGQRGRGVWRALPAIAVPFAVYLTINRALTGQALPNGAAAKSLFAGDLTVMRALTILGRNLPDLAWTFTVQGRRCSSFSVSRPGLPHCSPVARVIARRGSCSSARSRSCSRTAPRRGITDGTWFPSSRWRRSSQQGGRTGSCARARGVSVSRSDRGADQEIGRGNPSRQQRGEHLTTLKHNFKKWAVA